jgi:hypothetical protein
MKEWHRTVLLVLFLLVMIGLIVWTLRVPEDTLTQGL